MKILFVATHGVGDLIIISPLLEYLREGNELTVLVNGRSERDILKEIIKGNINIYEFNTLKFFEKIKLLIKLNFDKYDVLLPQVGITKFKFLILLFLLKGKLSIKYLYNKNNFNLHKIKNNINLIKLFGININFSRIKNINYENNIHDNIEINLNKFCLPNKYIVISPGSFERESFKRWPAMNFGILAKLISEEFNINVVLVGSKNEIELCNDVNYASKNICLNLAGTTMIKELLIILSRATFIVSNCNSTSHIASILNIKCYAIYGPTDFYYTGPFYGSIIPISKGMSCSPCYEYTQHKGCGNEKCLKEISPLDIMKIIKKEI